MLATTDIDALATHVGESLGTSEWVAMTQESVDAFAVATGDHQWIHTDPDRAAATPFGGTIAHGYFTLALAPTLLAQVLALDGFAMAVNYGLDRLRFPAPLPVGDLVRMHARLDGFQRIPSGAALALGLTFERSGGGKPVCVAQALYRVYEEEPS
jgi:acyl dehydratase